MRSRSSYAKDGRMALREVYLPTQTRMPKQQADLGDHPRAESPLLPARLPRQRRCQLSLIKLLHQLQRQPR